MFPNIVVDHQKCTTPFDCKRCLEICPQAVFEVGAVKIEKFKEADKKEPGTWKVFPTYRDKCTGCEECVKICPVDAITLSYPEEVKR